MDTTTTKRTVGAFEYDPTTRQLAGPATYMAEQGSRKLARIMADQDAGFRAMMAASPVTDTVTLVLVAMQTDYSGWIGMRRTLGAIRPTV